MTIKELLEQFLRMYPKTKRNNKLRYRGAYDLVSSLGKNWSTEVSDILVPKGMKKQCYRNAANAAWAYKNLRYVEGFALFMGMPISHAWIVDEYDRVVDSTWDKKSEEYFGVAFSTKFLSAIAFKTGMYGLIPDMPSKKFDPYLNGYPKYAILK